MKIKALKSFSGSLSMSKGEVVNCNRMDVVNDLLKAGYVEEVKEITVTTAQLEQNVEKVEETKVAPVKPEQDEKQSLEDNKKAVRKKKDENK